MCDIHLEHNRHLIQGMDTASPEPDSLIPTIGTFNSTGEGFLSGQAAAVGGTCSSGATATVLFSRDRSCCYCLVSHLLLKSCLMMPGSAKVEMSPRSWSFLAIFLNIRLVIFPERVLGRLGAYWM